MTNPPFYTSETEMNGLAAQKTRPPNSACTGAPVEMICEGGEVEFVSRIIQESKTLRTKIKWYSSMLGKLSSVTAIIERLRDVGCRNYAVTEFVQGQKTRRWCVAWSWEGLRPPSRLARGTDAVEKKFLPFPAELEIRVVCESASVGERVLEAVESQDGLEVKWRNDVGMGVIRSIDGDVWSRKARRKKKTASGDDMEMDDDDEPKFVVKIEITQTSRAAKRGEMSGSITDVRLKWLQGQDSTIFESFHGWLKRAIG